MPNNSAERSSEVRKPWIDCPACAEAENARTETAAASFLIWDTPVWNAAVLTAPTGIGNPFANETPANQVNRIYDGSAAFKENR
jgi:hypothetical protein